MWENIEQTVRIFDNATNSDEVKDTKSDAYIWSNKWALSGISSFKHNSTRNPKLHMEIGTTNVEVQLLPTMQLFNTISKAKQIGRSPPAALAIKVARVWFRKGSKSMQMARSEQKGSHPSPLVHFLGEVEGKNKFEVKKKGTSSDVNSILLSKSRSGFSVSSKLNSTFLVNQVQPTFTSHHTTIKCAKNSTLPTSSHILPTPFFLFVYNHEMFIAQASCVHIL